MQSKWIAAVALAGLMVIGCESKESSTTTPSPANNAAETTGSAANSAANTANEAAGTAANTAGNAANTAGNAANEAANTAGNAANNAQTASESTGATTQPGAAASDAQAQTLINQAMTYIKQNKMDLADKALTQAESMKSSLSPTMQTALTKARSAFNAAKAGGGNLNVPSLPGSSQ